MGVGVGGGGGVHVCLGEGEGLDWLPVSNHTAISLVPHYTLSIVHVRVYVLISCVQLQGNQ